MKKRLIIVDLSGFIFRAFYAIKPLHSPDGKPVNAVHGVLSMLLKLIAQHKPTNILLARDSRAPTFRKKMYPEYKANRPAPPEDLIPQFGLIEQMVQKMELANFSLEGYEADDLIGSIVTQWRNNFDEIFIASSDKDLMQFVDDKVKIGSDDFFTYLKTLKLQEGDMVFIRGEVPWDENKEHFHSFIIYHPL